MSFKSKWTRHPLWQRIAIIILIVGALYTILYYFWINPQNNEIPKDSQIVPISQTTAKTPNI